MIKIVFDYQVRDSGSWLSATIQPEYFFDLDADEKPRVDSLVRYAKLSEYFPEIPVSSIRFIKATIYESDANSSEVRETYWNSGLNMCRYDLEKRNGFLTEEIVLSLAQDKSAKQWRTIRLFRNEQGFFQNMADIVGDEAGELTYSFPD